MGIPLYHTDLLSYDGDVNFMKAAIETAGQGDDSFAKLCLGDT